MSALALDTLPKVIWMQLSVRNEEAAARAERKGVTVIMNRCPKIEFGRLLLLARSPGTGDQLAGAFRQETHPGSEGFPEAHAGPPAARTARGDAERSVPATSRKCPPEVSPRALLSKIGRKRDDRGLSSIAIHAGPSPMRIVTWNVQFHPPAPGASPRFPPGSEARMSSACRS